MDIRPLNRPEGLNEFLLSQPLQPFLQSWAWGEFQRRLGRRIWRIGAFIDGRLLGAALVVEHQLVLGKTYLYCPRGPVAATKEVLHGLLAELRRLGRDEGAMYVKVDPAAYEFPYTVRDFPPEYSEGSPLQEPATLVIDTTQPLETLQGQMHQKTRYNIRLAEKKGVSIRWSTSDDDYATFMKLQHETAARQGIRLHSDHYYRTMYETLRSNNMVELLVGEYEGKPLAINEIVWFGTTATFLHGGSANHNKDVMAAYLVQWRTIEECQRRGMKNYDLRGIAPDNHPEHKLAGVTRFKKGFGGRVVEYLPAANSVLQPQWYTAYRLAKRFRGGFDD